jgi:hypothetical protein
MLAEAESKTWLDCYRDPLGTVYAEETITAEIEAGMVSVRGQLRRGPYNLCAYVGVPTDSPTAGWSEDLVPLDVHGGLAFAALGDTDWPAGWWWYGWDYGHAFDRNWIGIEMAEKGFPGPWGGLRSTRPSGRWRWCCPSCAPR